MATLTKIAKYFPNHTRRHSSLVPRQGLGDEGFKKNWRQRRSKPSIHRVSRSLPRLDSAFQHLDVGKALLLIFRCLTDSARFAGSSSIENDFLRLWQRGRAGLELGERYGPFQI